MSKILAEALLKSPEAIIDYEVACGVVYYEPYVETLDLDLLTSSTSGIVDPLGQLRDWLASQLETVKNLIVSGVTSWFDTWIRPTLDSIFWRITDIWDTIRGIGDVIRDAITTQIPTLAGEIVNKIETVVLDPIRSFVDWVSDTFSGLKPIADTILSLIDVARARISEIPEQIMGLITNLSGRISSAIENLLGIVSSVADGISSTLTNLMSRLSSAVSDITSTIISVLSGIPATISDIVNTIISSLMRIPDTISSIVTTIITTLSAIPETIGSVVTTIMETLTGMPATIGEVVEGIISAITRIPEEIGKAVSGIVDAIKGIVDPIAESLGKIVEKVPDIFTGVESAVSGLQAISKGISEFIDTLLRLPEKAPEIYNTIVSSVWTNLIEPLTSTLYEKFVAPFTKGLDEIVGRISAGFTELGKVTTGFINAILQLSQWIPKWFEEHIVRCFIDEVRKTFNISKLVEAFIDPVSWIAETLIKAFERAGRAIWEGIQWIWKMIADGLKNVTELVWDSIKGFFIYVTNFFAKTFSNLSETVKDVTETITGAVKGIFEELSKRIQETYVGFYLSVYEKIFKELGIGTPEILKIDAVQSQLISGHAFTIGAMFLPLWGQLPVRMMSYGLMHLARTMRDMSWKLRLYLRPRGVGIDTEFDFAKAIGASLYTYARNLLHWLDTVSTGLAYGYAIWISQPLTRIISYHFRNIIPVQIPQELQIIEFCRRTLQYDYVRLEPTEFYKKTLDFAKYYMSLMGYSDEALRWFFSYSKEDWITIADRFGVERKLPISLVHELPSPSDFARWMVRDLFGWGAVGLDSFIKSMQMRGMTQDIAYMHYLYHFRYPPPEKLWTFTIRGISGLLWNPWSGAEEKEAREEIERVKAFVPKPPTELNFAHKQLLDAFKMYMKWHDYTRFSWIKGFTSDNAIIIDTVADIPTKIDQRWMVKWGLYETLSEKGVKLGSQISEFRTKTVEAQAKSAVRMDLTNFCRTLQATGLHPDWIPLTAVAEAMNALTEERTLLRTGFMNLFKEGFWNVEALETLLKGFVMASFQVSYFDSKELRWGTGWINQPVMFLPAERKLLELRALMDRALDILRDIGRDVARGYSEWIIADYEEYRNRLTKIIDHINKFFAKDYKDITGVDLPDKLKLQFIEAYYKPYVEGLEIYRDVFTIRRVRYWTQRWLGYIMYRLATGVVKKEDIEKLATYVSEKAKLTPYEKEFIQGVMELMLGIAVRDYIPTPSQLATLAEYVVISEDYITQVFEERFVPEKWRELWKNYIDIRPVADDIKALLTTWRRVLRYGKIPEELEKEVKEYAKKINFTEEEWKILELRATLEEMTVSRREYVPPLSTLASWAEYMTIPEDLIKKVFEVRLVAEEWQEYWKKYIDVRPIVDDVRGLLTSYRRALVYTTVPEDIKRKVEAYATTIGFTAREWDILTLRVNLEELVLEAREARREYVPPLGTLVTWAEYMVVPKDLIKRVFEARMVAVEWRPYWEKYIDVRPIADDVKGLLTTYRRALLYTTIPEDIKKKVENYASLIGFTDREWDVLTLRVNLEELILEAREAKREYIPTPSMLATIVEYVPRAREFFNKVMETRRVPVEWQSIWADYVDLRPIISEVRRYIARAEDLFTYFAVDEESYKKVLDEVKKFGYTDKEIELMLTSAKYERYLRAWREVVGDPARLATLAEYSPKARELAIGQLEKMIDALPIEEDKKEFIKQMWREYIRIRPVMDEVRRYITELMSDFAEGIITEDEYVKELEALKEWGLDDYEIKFYKAIGGMRKARYLARRRR